MTRLLVFLAAGGALLALVGCGSSKSREQSPKSREQSRPSRGNAGSRLRGFGATPANFARYHVNAPFSDAPANLVYANGHVSGWEVFYKPAAREHEARIFARREIPPDARKVLDLHRPTCRQIQYASATLTRLFGAARGKEGGMMVEFSTESGTGEPLRYDPSRITSILYALAAVPDRTILC